MSFFTSLLFSISGIPTEWPHRIVENNFTALAQVMTRTSRTRKVLPAPTGSGPTALTTAPFSRWVRLGVQRETSC
jgi:hypothetical protein